MTEAGMLNLTIRDNLASPPRRIVRRPTLFAALADVVIAPVWSTEERGSIPRGGAKFKDVNSKNLYIRLLI